MSFSGFCRKAYSRQYLSKRVNRKSGGEIHMALWKHWKAEQVDRAARLQLLQSWRTMKLHCAVKSLLSYQQEQYHTHSPSHKSRLSTSSRGPQLQKLKSKISDYCHNLECKDQGFRNKASKDIWTASPMTLRPFLMLQSRRYEGWNKETKNKSLIIWQTRLLLLKA